MSIQHHCNCVACRKFNHHLNTCKCQGSKNHHDNCNCQRFNNHHDNCNCQRFNNHHDNCNCHGFNNHHNFNNFNSFNDNQFHRKGLDCCHHDHDFKHHDSFEGRLFCDDRFRVRLGGLKSGMAFRLRQLLDCDVKLLIAEEKEKIKGKIILVGTDFVEILINNDQFKSDCKMKTHIVPFESIKLIENLD
jgi:hypothetical protein